MVYYCDIEKENDKMFTVRFPDMTNITTFGFSEEHALEMAKEALDGVLAVCVEKGVFVPQPTYTAGKPIEVSAKIAFAMELKRTRSGRSQSEIAKKLGMSYQQYQRLENPKKTNPTLETLEKLQKVFSHPFLTV